VNNPLDHGEYYGGQIGNSHDRKARGYRLG